MSRNSPSLKDKISSVPEKPGIYIFRDKEEKLLYVGKAKSLRARLRSYFRNSSGLDSRKLAMLHAVNDFEYTVTQNELEALVLEANLIKQHRPRYNILLRDDKSYPYLKLTVNEKWPRLFVVRRTARDGAEYFGPYVPSGPMWEILSFVRTNFKIPSCRYPLDRTMRPCIQHQIKKCVAPCSGRVNRVRYSGMIREIRLLLSGKNDRLIRALEKKMAELSEKMRYEEAAAIRDRIQAVRKISETQKAAAPGLGNVDVIGFYVCGDIVCFKVLFSRNGIMVGSKQFRVRNKTGESDYSLLRAFIELFYGNELLPADELLCQVMPENKEFLSEWLTLRRGRPGKVSISVPRRGIRKKLVDMAKENARILAESADENPVPVQEEIREALDLPSAPENIGAFDISNISGNEAVGAFVYWEEGHFIRDKFRHIRMADGEGPDDYRMMREMVEKTADHFSGRLPDLVMIDGGRGHLEAIMQLFREKGLTAGSVVSIAKDPDRIFLPSAKEPILLVEGKPYALLLRKIRDEAHRFAVSYHRKLRSMKHLESPLEKIPGIGRKRRFALLRHFGSIDAIKNSTAEDIGAVKGLNKKLAAVVLSALGQVNQTKEIS